jgi:aspartate/methionine/tyrosine aminotransferase/methylase of polypeptide subunit release factors
MPASYLERARELLGLLRDPQTRARGEALALDLARRTGSGEETELQVRSVTLEGGGDLEVLTLPSIFAPEEWGRTFLRGLLARPSEAYRGRTVVELGSGSGWVAIALAKLTPLAKVYALDLNPHAALVTEINARLAGEDLEGRSVASKIETGVSDLLSSLEAKDVTVDLVCGNIPQVLGPEEVERAHELTEDAPARVLRMLGDYTPPTGHFEDVLSLGLIANALERALPRLKPEGRIVLNLAGRPGFDAIRWVFARWGYAPRVIAKARILQDPGTDISPFARAEEATQRRFFFYSSREAKEPISAREARERQHRGEPTFHDLYVVEGRPYRHLAADGARRFLAGATARIPYTEDPGTELPELRAEASVYLSTYLRLHALPEEVFVAPARGELLRAIVLAASEPGSTVLLDASLAEHAPDLSRADREVAVVATEPIEDVVARDPKPRVVVASLGSRKRPNELRAERVARLVAACESAGALLVLDRTFAPIASLRRDPDELDRLLDGIWRGGRVIVTIDLARHLALDAYPLALALTGPLFGAVQRAADVTYSRAPTVAEEAHRCVLATLNERYRGPRQLGAPPPLSSEEPIEGESDLARELARMPAFEPVPPFRERANRPRIRLDFGESEFPVSERLKRGLLDGARERDRMRLEAEARDAAARFLTRSRVLSGPNPPEGAEIVLGAGAQPLIASAIHAARALGNGKTPLVVLPRPFYGMFPGIILGARGEIAPVSTSFDFHGRLRLDEDELGFRLDRAHDRPIVLLLSHPNNPTGAYYERGCLERTLDLARARQAIVVVDEVFFTLRHAAGADLAPRPDRVERRSSGRFRLGRIPVDVPPEAAAAALEAPASALNLALGSDERTKGVLVLDSLSKAFAAGGVRLGFAWARDTALRGALAAHTTAPDGAALGAARAQLSEFEEDLAGHVIWLAKRVQRALAVCRELRLEVVVPEGGLFLSVDFTSMERRTWVGTDVWGHAARAPRPPTDDFRRTLAEAAGLVVSPDHWSGWSLPHRRIVFSIEDLDTALVRLRAFSTVLG